MWFMMRAFVLLIAVLALAALGRGSETYPFKFSGGFSFCSSCAGPGEYACNFDGIGDFQTEHTFTDRGGFNERVSNISITLNGNYNCIAASAPTIITVYLNDVLVDGANWDPVDSLCQCDKCDGSWIFKSNLPSTLNLPSYKVGGVNTVRLSVDRGEMCLSSFSLTMGYSPDTNTALGVAYVPVVLDPLALQGAQVCGGPGQYLFTPFAVDFTDVIPPGRKLISVEAAVFGIYYCSADDIAITANVQDVLAAQGEEVNTRYFGDPCPSDGCDGVIYLKSKAQFQAGWPGYNYGGTNTLTVSASISTQIHEVGIYLYYFPL